MTTVLFGRTARVLAYQASAGVPGGFVSQHPNFFETLPNGIEIKNLRIRAQVEKHTDKEPNTCKIVITNCNERARTFLKQKPLIVLLQAGYNNQLNYLFRGDARTVFSEFTGATIETHLELADGDRAFRYAQINKTYRKHTSVITAVRDAAQTLGLRLDASIQASTALQTQFAAGRTLSGATRKELSELLTPFGYKWSIQDGTLTILRDSETRGAEAILVSEDTGMVGSPTFTTPDKPGKPVLVKVKTKLETRVAPGTRFAIRSRDIHTAAFRAEKITHDIDTREGPFDTTLEGAAA